MEFVDLKIIQDKNGNSSITFERDGQLITCPLISSFTIDDLAKESTPTARRSNRRVCSSVGDWDAKENSRPALEISRDNC